MSRDSKAATAYEWLSGQIRSRRFGPGHRLVLTQLAEELGVSVVPVREAMRRLEAEGLVTYQRNVGATVALIDDRKYAEVMESLGVTEGAATALAAPHVTTATLEAARAVNAELAALVASLDAFDPERFTQRNHDLHALLYRPCPNRHLLDLVERDWARLDSMRDSSFSFIPGRAVVSVREHDRLIDLVASGAPGEQIEQLVREHRMATVAAVQRRRGAAVAHGR